MAEEILSEARKVLFQCHFIDLHSDTSTNFLQVYSTMKFDGSGNLSKQINK